MATDSSKDIACRPSVLSMQNDYDDDDDDYASRCFPLYMPRKEETEKQGGIIVPLRAAGRSLLWFPELRPTTQDSPT